MTHDFTAEREFSETAGSEPFWDAVYRQAFPNLVAHMPCPGDFASQRMGIDRVLLLSNGKTLAIDEKKRREVYTDILLEYISVDTTQAPGWMEKDLAIDFLAYAFMPTQRVYLLPWPILRRAWLHYGAEWKRKFRSVPGKNPTYTTWSIAVPIGVLLQAVSNAQIVQLPPEA
jgi:hypothetical protein